MNMSLECLQNVKQGVISVECERTRNLMTEIMVRTLDFIESSKESHWGVLGSGVILSDLNFKKSFLATVGIMKGCGQNFKWI